jgi:hypothetical protein
MADQVVHGFHRRRNENGTFDSICLRCFLTAASAPGESELSSLERRHVCALAPRGFVSDTLNYGYVGESAADSRGRR